MKSSRNLFKNLISFQFLLRRSPLPKSKSRKAKSKRLFHQKLSIKKRSNRLPICLRKSLVKDNKESFSIFSLRKTNTEDNEFLPQRMTREIFFQDKNDCLRKMLLENKSLATTKTRVFLRRI